MIKAKEIAYTSIRTNDIEAAVCFYCDIFHFEPLKRIVKNEGTEEEVILQFVRLGNNMLEIYQTAREFIPADGTIAMFGIYVEDIYETLRELKGKKVEIIDEEPWEGWEDGIRIAAIRGSSGEQIMIVQNDNI